MGRNYKSLIVFVAKGFSARYILETNIRTYGQRNVVFGVRLDYYEYYDIDKVIFDILNLIDKIGQEAV